MINKQNDIIVALIGESGCGKTTVAKLLEKEGYNIIHSYTTRKAREENEWGHTFVDLGDIEFSSDYSSVFFHNEDRIEHVIAYVYYNHNHYWATREQYLNKGASIYIIDPTGYLDLRKKVKNPIIGIYLDLPLTERADRLIQRDGSVKAFERLEHDVNAFLTIQTDWVLKVVGMSPDDISSHIKKIINKSLLSPPTVISQ